MSEQITVSLHLPGLKKTIQYSFDSHVPNTELSNKIALDFKQEPRRSNVFLLGPGFIGTMHAYELWINSTPRVKNGDTLVLCVRKTLSKDQNEYYTVQQDALLHNKYLEPSLTQDIARYLLIQTHLNFELLGFKYFLPGTKLYDYSQSLDAEIFQYYKK